MFSMLLFVGTTLDEPLYYVNSMHILTRMGIHFGVTLQMLHNIQFHGLPSENSNAHLKSFIEVCDTVKYNGVTEEALKVRLFLLSLSDRAKHWLTSQPPDSITT